MSKLPQIPLDLTPSPKHSFDTLIVSHCNQDAVTTIKGWPNWTSPVLLLTGPTGSGKTHIGSAWALETGGMFIDNAPTHDEVKLFAVFNKALNGDIQGLLLTSEHKPAQWDIAMPDLRSRLSNTPIVSLQEHDDVILEPILRKLFEDLGRNVTADLVGYILKHHDRSVPALRDIARELDLAAQSQKVDLTKSFAAKYMR